MSDKRPVPLEDILITDQLDRRPARAPALAAESEALLALVRTLKQDKEGNVFQHLAQTALRLCGADAAGVSIEEEVEGRKVVRWHGAAGTGLPLLWHSIPRQDSPCGTALDRKAPVLMAHPDRHFGVLRTDAPPLAEVLIVPFAAEGRAAGTVWVVTHDATRHFDREDLRQLITLGECAALGYQVLQRNMRLREALTTERQGSQLLQAISAGLTREEDVHALYGQILDAARVIMGADFASLQSVEGDRFRMLAHRGLHPLTVRFLQESSSVSTSPPGVVLRLGRLVMPDIELCPGLEGTPDLKELRRSNIRALQATPLMSYSGGMVGVLATHWRVPHEPSAGELRLLDVLARLAADLMERARTHDALRERERKKNEFLALLSHELRNPLAPLTTGLELLRHPDCPPGHVRKIHDMMSRQVSHLTRLVNELLDMARITRGTVELRPTRLELPALIEAAIELARPLIDQRGHRLKVEQAVPALVVRGDAERLTQVLAIVLSNAARYSDQRGLILLQAGAEAGEAVIRVQDSGLGIPPDSLEAVFEMFTQVPEHRDRSGGGGLGIGLALARQLIQLHGGSIVARSQGLGCGSEFIIRLPLTTGAAGQAAPPPPFRESPPVHPARILIIEDNVEAATALRLDLESAGHIVRVAHEGLIGLAFLQDFTPAAVILDAGLADMDVFETARRIRALPTPARVLIIAVTARDQEIDGERARQAGIDVHLTRPVTVAALHPLLTLPGPG